jgi:hypothetical protein
MRMELTQLRSFYAIARDRSVTRAATRLGLTQPALSLQIKAIDLVERQDKRRSPTAVAFLRMLRAHLPPGRF